MNKIKQLVADLFARQTRKIYNNPFKTILLTALLSVPLMLPVLHIRLDASPEGVLHGSDSGIRAYNEFRERFGTDEFLIIAIESDNIFSEESLRRLSSLHRDLHAKVPYMEDITSLHNARYISGSKGEKLTSRAFLINYPRNQEQQEKLREKVLNHPLYRNIFISDDARMATILIRTKLHRPTENIEDVLKGFEDDRPASAGNDYASFYLNYEEKSLAVNTVKKIIEEYQGPNFKIYLSGTTVISTMLKDAMAHDIRIFISLCLLVIAISLFLMFHRVSGIVLPLIVVILTLLSTLGIMVISGRPIKVPSQMIPSFLLAVCVCDSVHILALFFNHLRNGLAKENAIIQTFEHAGLPIVMTSLTTAAGLFSFITADIAPVADVGIFAGTGVILGLIYTIVLLPAMIAIFPLKDKDFSAQTVVIDRILQRVAAIPIKHPGKIMFCTLLITLGAYFGAQQVRFTHDVLAWFPEDNPIREATEIIDSRLKGSVNLEVIIDTGKEAGIYAPGFMQRLEKAATYSESLDIDGIFGGKALSITSLIKEINRAINDGDPASYVIPDSEEAIAQEILLFENTAPRQILGFTDSRHSMARFTIKVPFRDSVRYTGFLDNVTEYFKREFPDTSITITGMMPLLHATSTRAMHSMIESYLIALAVITVLMIILIGGLRIGLLSMIPNLVPIFLTIGLMGAMGINMDLTTMMIASIAIGLAVDDTIHFMHMFRYNYDICGDPHQAVIATFNSTGRAMLATSIVLSMGFFVFMFATMKNIVALGMLTGVTILLALLADFMITPALMILANPRKEPKNEIHS